MKIFLDSAEINDIKKAYDWGIVEGVTTNPSLIKEAVDKRVSNGEKVDMKKYVEEILKTARGTPVSLEVTETSAQGMIEQGKKLFQMFNPIGKNVVIKIPINPSFTEQDDRQMDGLIAVRALSKARIPVNCTLIFTPEQALLAAKAGAKYVSPFVGRIDDILRTQNRIQFEKGDYFPAEGIEKKRELIEDKGVVSGIDLLEQCVAVIDNYGLKTEVLAASIRNTRQVREAALVGCDIATVPIETLSRLSRHHLTYDGIQKFTRDIVLEYMELTNGHKINGNSRKKKKS